MGEMLVIIASILYTVTAPVSMPAACIALAVLSARRGGGVDRRRLFWGAVLTVTGLAVLARLAWAAREGVGYGNAPAFAYLQATLIGAPLLFLGLGPWVPWVLRLPARFSVRLPRALRPAARELADHRPRVAGWTATSMLAAGLAVTLMITTFAQAAQLRAHYRPEARPGTLTVDVSATERAAAARAALEREFPEVPLVISRDPAHGYVLPDVDQDVWGDALIGDQALLRYLTGDPATPYDPGTVVFVTAGTIPAASVRLDYQTVFSSAESLSETVPATTAAPADPRVERVFIPAEAVEALGFDLAPEKLIIDPSVHRATAAEQERLDDRLGDTLSSYVERGYQAPSAWLLVLVGVPLLAALAGALTATVSAGADPGWRRVRHRIAGGSGGRMRALAASRAWLTTACGTTLGAAAGCVSGLLLAWPVTVPDGYDATFRVAFDTPWLLIAALVAGLPVVVAVLAALLPARSGAPRRGRGADIPAVYRGSL